MRGVLTLRVTTLRFLCLCTTCLMVNQTNCQAPWARCTVSRRWRSISWRATIPASIRAHWASDLHGSTCQTCRNSRQGVVGRDPQLMNLFTQGVALAVLASAEAKLLLA